MPGPRDVTDSNVQVRAASDGDFTADESISITIRGGVHKTSPLQLVVLVPTDSGASDTLVVTAKSTDTDKKVEVTHTDAILGGTTTFPYILRLPLPVCDSEGWDIVLDITDGGGSVNFGEVEAWLEPLELPKVDTQ